MKFRLWHKVTVAALGAVGVTGLVMAGPASARVPAVVLTVCNDAANAQRFNVTGIHENGPRVTTPTMTVEAKKCTLVSNYLWASGSNLGIAHQIGESKVVNSPFNIPADAPDGSSQTATITAFGP